jgi:hypothetical protein
MKIRLVVLAACALLPGAVLGQAVVTGTVAEEGSLQPIQYAEVRVTGSDQVAVTNATGHFTLTDVGGNDGHRGGRR